MILLCFAEDSSITFFFFFFQSVLCGHVIFLRPWSHVQPINRISTKLPHWVLTTALLYLKEHPVCPKNCCPWSVVVPHLPLAGTVGKKMVLIATALKGALGGWGCPSVKASAPSQAAVALLVVWEPGFVFLSLKFFLLYEHWCHWPLREIDGIKYRDSHKVQCRI